MSVVSADQRSTGTFGLILVALTYAGGFFLSNGVIAVAISQNWYSRSMSAAYFGGFAVLCTVTAVHAFLRAPAVFNRREVVFTALFWLLYTLRLAQSVYVSGAPLILPREYYIYYTVAGCLIPMGAFLRAMDARSAAVAYRAVFTSAVVSMAACLWVYRSLLGTAFGRLGMSLEDALNPLQVAYLGSGLFVLAAYDILYRQRGFVFLSVRFLACALAIGLGFLGLTIGASKGAVLSVIVCVLAVFVSKLFAKRYVASTLFVAVFVSLLPRLARLTSELGSGLIARFSDLTEYTGEGRLALVAEAMSDFALHPVFGSGLELSSKGYPHNIIAEAFLSTGIFGGTLFVGLCAWATLRSMRILVRAPEQGWIALLFIHYLVMAEVSGAIYLSWSFWYSYAAVMGTRVVDEPASKKSGSTKPIHSRRAITGFGLTDLVPAGPDALANGLVGQSKK